MSVKVKDFVKRYASSMNNVSRPGRTAGVAMGGGAIGGGDDYRQKIGRNKIPWNLRDFQGSPSMSADAGFSGIAMQRIASPDSVTKSKYPMFPNQDVKDDIENNNYSLAEEDPEEQMKELKTFNENAHVEKSKYSLVEIDKLMSEDVASWGEMGDWVRKNSPDAISNVVGNIEPEDFIPDIIEDEVIDGYNHVVEFLDTVKEKYGDPAYELIVDKLDDITGGSSEEVLEKAAEVAKEIGRDVVMLAAAGLPIVGTPIAASFIAYNLAEMQVGMNSARIAVDRLITYGTQSDVDEVERVTTQLYNDYIDFLQAIPYIIPFFGTVKGAGKIAGKVANSLTSGNMKRATSFVGLGGSGAFASALRSEILLSPVFEFATGLSDIESLDDIGIDSTYFIDNAYKVPAALSVLSSLRDSAESQLDEWKKGNTVEPFKFIPTVAEAGDTDAIELRIGTDIKNSFDNKVNDLSSEIEDAVSSGSVESIFENIEKEKKMSGEDLIRSFIRESIYHKVNADNIPNPTGYEYRQPMESEEEDDDKYKKNPDMLVNYKSDMGGISYQSAPEALREEALRRIIRRKLEEAKKKTILKSDEKDDDDKDVDEQSVSTGVAGYSLPLGASNFGTSLKQRGEYTAKSFGGGSVGKSVKKPSKKRRKRKTKK